MGRSCKSKLKKNEWQFIAVCAGGNSSSFYEGDLNKKPLFLETVKNDICGATTHRIGNSGQGPGKVAMIKVFNYKLNVETIENEYYCSKCEVSLQWNQKELEAI